MKKALSSLITLFMLQGCAGYVGGDLEDVVVDTYLDQCRYTPAYYEMKVYTDAVNDYADENISGIISTYTLGLFPTYWLSEVNSKVTIEDKGKEVYAREDVSRIHTFYGILWLLFLSDDSVNALRADEGSGLRVIEGIQDRAVAKTLNEMPDSIDINELCVTYLDL
ncbi:hypothetical protein CAG70_15985 [Photobacterium halotolerans]|uniref:hypothetical protein n=1 Tax=Photobacterium halotolerans TaxID=265726 RepID=UPI00137266B0|nr:hypothetical protein [Photobacterium halotolerans]NAX48483.1 hypothetical protein [Photobacterium halotolerans]